MIYKLFNFIGLLTYFTFSLTNAQSTILDTSPDVASYHAVLEPDLEKHYIKGNVVIDFGIDSGATTAVFDIGNLQIAKVIGKTYQSHEQKDRRLIITLKESDTKRHLIQVFYQGSPTRGIVFTESNQIYTVFSTSEWMVCNRAPNDRATFRIDLLIPNKYNCIASGVLVGKREDGKKSLYSWSQDYETPAYTYGFAIGEFKEYIDEYHGIALNYYSDNYTNEQLERIFCNTADMIAFFEEKSGVNYPQKSYSQILIGNHYQEMSGFAVLKDSYGALVLKDSTETNLISHELAHQWWGNNITCTTWNYFWLNEGFATFMSAAYNEHRFGKEGYLSDIESYYNVYKKIKENGGDKSLVFDDWISPSSDDRNLVYFKGAYVLHRLRLLLGDQPFWQGVKPQPKVLWPICFHDRISKGNGRIVWKESHGFLPDMDLRMRINFRKNTPGVIKSTVRI